MNRWSDRDGFGIGLLKKLLGISKLPKDVIFIDQNGNHVTKNTVRSAKSVEEHYKEELQLIQAGDTILDNVKE